MKLIGHPYHSLPLVTLLVDHDYPMDQSETAGLLNLSNCLSSYKLASSYSRNPSFTPKSFTPRGALIKKSVSLSWAIFSLHTTKSWMTKKRSAVAGQQLQHKVWNRSAGETRFVHSTISKSVCIWDWNPQALQPIPQASNKSDGTSHASFPTAWSAETEGKSHPSLCWWLTSAP